MKKERKKFANPSKSFTFGAVLFEASVYGKDSREVAHQPAPAEEELVPPFQSACK